MKALQIQQLGIAPIEWNSDADPFTAVLEFITSVVFVSITFGENGESRLPLIVVWLVSAAVFFTTYLGFMNIRGFKHAIDLVRGRFSKPEDAGEVSHFQALATAVSGTVGLGNIAGVAVAISLGGPGATFWMIAAGFLGMSTKLAECTLGVKYRRRHADGSVSGGPMYYPRDGVAALGKPGLGKVLAAAFAVFCILGSLGGGNMFQSNQATLQLLDVTGADADNKLLAFGIGAVFAAIVGSVILGGIKSIARVTEKVVPLMAVIYVSACLIVILGNLGQVPTAFGDIIAGAFNPEGIAGGMVGVLIVGFQRAAFSNEAGVGSASIAHSAVKTEEPSTEGHVALLEPFIDTIVICTMTALTIVITGVWNDPEAADGDGVRLTSSAFESVIPWFPNVLAIAVVLFALSTMLSWSYYGMKATGYLFGDNPVAENVYKVVFCGFTILGSGLALNAVLGFSDAAIFLMSIPNVIGLYLLARVLKGELSQYREKVRTGEFARVK